MRLSNETIFKTTFTITYNVDISNNKNYENSSEES